MDRKTRFLNVSTVSQAIDISVFKAIKNVHDMHELFRFPGASTAVSNIKPEHIEEYGIGEPYDNNNTIHRSNCTMEGTILVTAWEKDKIRLTVGNRSHYIFSSNIRH